MSYCRWSCDNHRSDIYCYEASSGFKIHIASNRIVGDPPPLPSIPIISDDLDAWAKAYSAHYHFMDNCEREAITLPNAGKTFTESTPESCIERLLQLRSEGFHVPEHAFDGLRVDIAEAAL